MRNKYCAFLASASALASSIFWTASSAAQTATAGTETPAAKAPATSDAANQKNVIADIVVTAEHRETNVQKTAIAITALGGDSLRESGIQNIEGLNQHIPNLTFARDAGDAKIYIRGVGYNALGPGGETRVAVYLDGIYQSRTQAGLLGFYDVDRVEVLRGPQGTLYGRNAVAGAINILSREPGRTLNGYVTGTVGDYGLVGVVGAVGGAISSDLQARIAFKSVDRQGYGTNITSGVDVDDEHSRSVRAKLKWQPDSRVTIRLQGDYTREKDHSGGYRYLGGASLTVPPLGPILGIAPTNPHDTAGSGPNNSIKTYGFQAQIDYALSDSTTLTALSGYRHLQQSLFTNTDGTTAGLNIQLLQDNSNSFSQEVRIAQKIGNIADLVVGGYYFHEANSALNNMPLSGRVEFVPDLDPTVLYAGYVTFGRLRTNALAAFAQANIHFTDQLELDVGARYSNEHKSLDEKLQLDFVNPFVSFNAPLNPIGSDSLRQQASSLDPKVTLSYKPNSNIFLFATYSRGFKSGGFNIGGLQPPFNPEKLTDYEVGIKADFFDHHLRTNLGAFYYDYKDLQVSITEGLGLVTRNAATARVKGMEAEITAIPVDDLRLVLNASYLDAKYRKFVTADPVNDPFNPRDLAGKRLSNAPRYKIDAEMGYTIHSHIGDFTPRFNITRIDKVYFTQFNTSDQYQPARTEINLYLDWSLLGSGWSATAYVKNVTNSVYVVDAAANSSIFGYDVIGQYGPPRTVGLSVTKKF